METVGDGDTIYWFEHSFEAAVDTDTNQHTIYDHHLISYTLEPAGAPCAARSYNPEPTALWKDDDGTTRYSMGSPLLVTCEE